MAAWKHYIRAIKESEPILDAEAHKQRKTQHPPLRFDLLYGC